MTKKTIVKYIDTVRENMNEQVQTSNENFKQIEHRIDSIAEFLGLQWKDETVTKESGKYVKKQAPQTEPSRARAVNR